MRLCCHADGRASPGSGKARDAEDIGGPANLHSVWDNVITWMRQAVEFVGLDKNPDSDKHAEQAAIRRGVSLVVMYFDDLYSNLSVLF